MNQIFFIFNPSWSTSSPHSAFWFCCCISLFPTDNIWKRSHFSEKQKKINFYMRRTSRSNCTLISEGKVMSWPKICTVAFSRFLDTELLRSFFFGWVIRKVILVKRWVPVWRVTWVDLALVSRPECFLWLMRPRDPTDPGYTPPNFSNERAFLSRSFLTFHQEAKNLNKINNNRDLFYR